MDKVVETNSEGESVIAEHRVIIKHVTNKEPSTNNDELLERKYKELEEIIKDQFAEQQRILNRKQTDLAKEIMRNCNLSDRPNKTPTRTLNRSSRNKLNNQQKTRNKSPSNKKNVNTENIKENDNENNNNVTEGQSKNKTVTFSETLLFHTLSCSEDEKSKSRSPERRKNPGQRSSLDKLNFGRARARRARSSSTEKSDVSDSDCSPTRKINTDTHLKNSNNPKLIQWLKQKNKIYKSNRTKIQKAEKETAKEKKREEEEKLQRKKEAQKKFKEWIKVKRRESSRSRERGEQKSGEMKSKQDENAENEKNSVGNSKDGKDVVITVGLKDQERMRSRRRCRLKMAQTIMSSEEIPERPPSAGMTGHTPIRSTKLPHIMKKVENMSKSTTSNCIIVEETAPEPTKEKSNSMSYDDWLKQKIKAGKQKRQEERKLKADRIRKKIDVNNMSSRAGLPQISSDGQQDKSRGEKKNKNMVRKSRKRSSSTKNRVNFQSPYSANPLNSIKSKGKVKGSNVAPSPPSDPQTFRPLPRRRKKRASSNSRKATEESSSSKINNEERTESNRDVIVVDVPQTEFIKEDKIESVAQEQSDEEVIQDSYVPEVPSQGKLFQNESLNNISTEKVSSQTANTDEISNTEENVNLDKLEKDRISEEPDFHSEEIQPPLNN